MLYEGDESEWGCYCCVWEVFEGMYSKHWDLFVCHVCWVLASGTPFSHS